jgi:hypothetical protein
MRAKDRIIFRFAIALARFSPQLPRVLGPANPILSSACIPCFGEFPPPCHKLFKFLSVGIGRFYCSVRHPFSLEKNIAAMSSAYGPIFEMMQSGRL